MNYSTIKRYDIANGPGIRTSIFFTGCTLHCKGCFNSEIWDFNSGKPFDKYVKFHLFELLADEHCVGLSVLGGEPTDQGDELITLLKEVKETFPNKTIWMWSGRLISGIPSKYLQYVDVLVDGQFVKSLSGKNIRFRGSSNQQIWKNLGDRFVNITDQF